MDSTSEGENNDFNFGRNFEFSAGPSGGNVQQVDNWPGAQGRSWGWRQICDCQCTDRA